MDDSGLMKVSHFLQSESGVYMGLGMGPFGLAGLKE